MQNIALVTKHALTKETTMQTLERNDIIIEELLNAPSECFFAENADGDLTVWNQEQTLSISININGVVCIGGLYKQSGEWENILIRPSSDRILKSKNGKIRIDVGDYSQRITCKCHDFTIYLARESNENSISVSRNDSSSEVRYGHEIADCMAVAVVGRGEIKARPTSKDVIALTEYDNSDFCYRQTTSFAKEDEILKALKQKN